jgi:hypothetical protein
MNVTGLASFEIVVIGTFESGTAFRLVIWLVVVGGIGNLEAILIDLQRPDFGLER